MFIGMGVRIGLLASAAAFSPSFLFAASEPGVWYDPSDLTTLFQDTAGTVPVTTPGQSVALVLDKSKGLTLGPELVTNGDFSNGSTGWTVSAQSSISGGQARIVSTDGSFQNIAQSKTLSGPAWYQVSLDVVSVVSGSINFSFTGAGANITVPSGTGRKTVMFFVASSTSSTLSFGRTAGVTDVTIDNISVKELAGNHATQATAASRPIYARNPITGTRNLLTRTEEIGTSPWGLSRTTVTANAATAPNGTLTADALVETVATGNHDAFIAGGVATSVGQNFTFSVYVKQFGSARRFTLLASSSVFGNPPTNNGASFDLSSQTVISQGANVTSASISAVGGGWYRVVCTMTTFASGAFDSIFCLEPVAATTRYTSYTGDGTSGILIWGAQLEVGSTATAYQKVVSQYDVTESGVADAYYLAFDGVDDFLVTPTITPGIDKAQVFAGVRKLAGTSGQIVESSTDTNANNGSMRLTDNSSASGQYAFLSKGTISAGAAASGYTPPITNVLSGIGDIAGDVARLRINGTQIAETLTDQGTGNFLAYPLYIGRRGGTTLPFNGRIYSLITRFGANLTAQQISDTETWVNGKTGAY